MLDITCELSAKQMIHMLLCCVVLLLNVHGQQLRSCWDGQLT